MNPSNFRARFDALVAALRSDPRIEVFSARVEPPASDEDIAAAEESVGWKLPADLRAFYLAHNGAFLEWGLKGETYSEQTEPFGFPDYGQPPGCINLLPVREAISPNWERDSHVNEIDQEHLELMFGEWPWPGPDVTAVCIDNFSKFNHGDLVTGPEPLMIVSTDHGADMDSSNFMSFSTYLDMTLALHGLNRYSYGAGVGWSNKPQLVERWTEAPTLDELLERLRKDET